MACNLSMHLCGRAMPEQKHVSSAPVCLILSSGARSRTPRMAKPQERIAPSLSIISARFLQGSGTSLESVEQIRQLIKDLRFHPPRPNRPASLCLCIYLWMLSLYNHLSHYSTNQASYTIQPSSLFLILKILFCFTRWDALLGAPRKVLPFTSPSLPASSFRLPFLIFPFCFPPPSLLCPCPVPVLVAEKRLSPPEPKPGLGGPQGTSRPKISQNCSVFGRNRCFWKLKL